MKNNTYFLFGREACNTYFDEDIQGVVEFIQDDGHYELYKWDTETSTPSELLYAFKDNDDYAVLTEEEYEILINL